MDYALVEELEPIEAAIKQINSDNELDSSNQRQRESEFLCGPDIM